uniref:Uncharacterized protein n=1 Tax=Aegilops tauschii subsp. strangulata TaxID=200361 RepID=A0A453A657_AEGTS
GSPNPTSTEGQGKMVVASPSTAPPTADADADADGSPHPTYPEMIKQALTELGGTSGRIAIAAFILDRSSPQDHTMHYLLELEKPCQWEARLRWRAQGRRRSRRQATSCRW